MKTTKTTTTTTAADSRNAFATLLRDYETETINTTDHNAATALYPLATALAYSVLKKLETTTANKTTRQLKQQLTADLANIHNLEYATANATTVEYNADGDRKEKIIDKNLYAAISTLAACSLSDGLDLVHAAAVVLLDETKKAAEREPLSIGYLEKPYRVRRLNRKVWIKTADSVNGWETAETTPIQEAFKAVRREIESNRAVQVANFKYTYIEDISKDSETDSETDIYRRLPKYSQLATETTDINGKVTSITADSTTAADIDTLIAALNISKQQATVLQYRLSGYGYKAIATALGVRSANVQTQVKRIAAKVKTASPQLYALAIEKGYITE